MRSKLPENFKKSIIAYLKNKIRPLVTVENNIILAILKRDYLSSSQRGTHRPIVEILWTIIPAIILFLIAVPSIKLLYYMDHSLTADSFIYTIKVIGHQWYWTYEYYNTGSLYEIESYLCDENTTLDLLGFRLLEVDNPLIVPAFNYIRFLVTSQDVLHSWAVPSLGIKVDAVPGRLNQISVFIKRDGTFYGQCSEICGVNHGFMPIKIIGIGM